MLRRRAAVIGHERDDSHRPYVAGGRTVPVSAGDLRDVDRGRDGMSVFFAFGDMMDSGWAGAMIPSAVIIAFS